MGVSIEVSQQTRPFRRIKQIRGEIQGRKWPFISKLWLFSPQETLQNHIKMHLLSLLALTHTDTPQGWAGVCVRWSVWCRRGRCNAPELSAVNRLSHTAERCERARSEWTSDSPGSRLLPANTHTHTHKHNRQKSCCDMLLVFKDPKSKLWCNVRLKCFWTIKLSHLLSMKVLAWVWKS